MEGVWEGGRDHRGALEEEGETREKEQQLNGKQRHQLKHRELFLSRQVETLPATHIRGKCSVTLLNETESLLSYLNKDDSFFYCLVFDPTHKTLLADKGEIRVGSRYQADPTALLKEDEPDCRNLEDLETLVWTPSHNLTDRQIDQFLVISRSVGTFARALDCSSSVKQPSLHMSAAAASRDVTLNEDPRIHVLRSELLLLLSEHFVRFLKPEAIRNADSVLITSPVVPAVFSEHLSAGVLDYYETFNSLSRGCCQQPNSLQQSPEAAIRDVAVRALQSCYRTLQRRQ
ncbi:hypothetical protein PR048_017270 [Dryococelus australis]|uniref:Uncharacterized protein n=1 Tax=Dryococelus australis TaxID=614101 RepID=A0ABQ9H946_9NEOP|nr:hypothetical protein PR048_017270 [Dryococelus australis]